ncbi:MAG: aminotransferase class III-fold pyridoxal phosphate-dependent enzyme, partial [Alphaproteobacteria bacterium]
MHIVREKVTELRRREDARFIHERPRSMARLQDARRCMPGGVPMSWMVTAYAHAPFFVQDAKGTYITDIDGHRYLDMNLADTSMSSGYGSEPVAEAVRSQFLRGSQFMLPTEDSVVVC